MSTAMAGVGDPDSGSGSGPGSGEDVRLARAYLSRVAEPATLSIWLLVELVGPVEAAQRIRARDLTGLPGSLATDVVRATEARAVSVDAHADLAVAGELGIDLVCPEDDQWPHFALATMYTCADRRAQRYLAGERAAPDSGELVPPLALWIRGTAELRLLGARSVAMVGARAATAYGEHVAGELAYSLARREVQVISGGAYGIDAAAHRGALGAGRQTVIVSAGGLDKPYPAANAALFARAADSGLLVSESPPGSAPQRHRFLSRNRLIAAFGTATVVVEAGRRSGAANTAAHARGLSRPLLAVPGPITSAMSAGCHALLTRERDPARLVGGVDDILAAIGDFGATAPESTAQEDRSGDGEARQSMDLDTLDRGTRRVIDGFPAVRWTDVESVSKRAGVPINEVMSAIPALELRGLVERSERGVRLVRPGRPAQRGALPAASR